MLTPSTRTQGSGGADRGGGSWGWDEPAGGEGRAAAVLGLAHFSEEQKRVGEGGVRLQPSTLNPKIQTPCTINPANMKT